MWHALSTYDAGGVPRMGLVLNNSTYDLRSAARLCDISFADSVVDVQSLLLDWAANAPRVAALAEHAQALVEAGTLSAVATTGAQIVPYEPRRIFATASNFHEHAQEMGTKLAERSESQPYVFMKAETSVIASGHPVLKPQETERLDWEVELAAVIGKTCRHVSVDDALSVVAAYTVFNDISARDLNRRTDFPFSHDWFRGKSFDTFGPMGPWLVPASCVKDPQNLRLTLSVNGEVMQDGNTSEMIFSLAEQIAYLSRILTLKPGDLIATGTPDGVGMGRGRYLAVGDSMIASIDGIGSIENRVELDDR
jgi:2,4-diketo-3-deoxy-L-fuconate hydrolase